MTNDPFSQDPLTQAMKAYQLHNPLKETMEAMRSYQLHDPFKETREAMMAFQLQDPLKDVREAMRAFQFQDPLREIRKSMKALQVRDLFKETREAINAIQLLDPLREIREAMRSFQLQDPLKAAREAMMALQVHDPLKEAREAMKALQVQDPFKEARDAIAALHLRNPFIEAHNAVKTMGIDSLINMVSQDKWPQAYDNFSDFVINEDGTLTIDSQTIAYSEIQDIMGRLVGKTSFPHINKFEQALDEILTEIRALKNPSLEKILTWLIFPIIVGIILSILNPITDYYIKDYLSKDKKQIERQLKKNILSSVKDTDQLKHYKIVSREILDVRFKPLPKSSVLGKLYFGQAVVIIEKRKKWSLVAWSDDDQDIMLQGWVLSKYLSKIH